MRIFLRCLSLLLLPNDHVERVSNEEEWTGCSWHMVLFSLCKKKTSKMFSVHFLYFAKCFVWSDVNRTQWMWDFGILQKFRTFFIFHCIVMMPKIHRSNDLTTNTNANGWGNLSTFSQIQKKMNICELPVTQRVSILSFAAQMTLILIYVFILFILLSLRRSESKNLCI